jgi:hypothetical protein
MKTFSILVALSSKRFVQIDRKTPVFSAFFDAALKFFEGVLIARRSNF